MVLTLVGMGTGSQGNGNQASAGIAQARQVGDVGVLVVLSPLGSSLSVASVTGLGGTWTRATGAMTATGRRSEMWLNTGLTASAAFANVIVNLTASATNFGVAAFVLRGLSSTAYTDAYAVISTAAGQTYSTPTIEAGDGQAVIILQTTTANVATFPVGPSPSTGWTSQTNVNSSTYQYQSAIRIPAASATHAVGTTTSGATTLSRTVIALGAPAAPPPQTLTLSVASATHTGRALTSTPTLSAPLGRASRAGVAHPVTHTTGPVSLALGLATRAATARPVGVEAVFPAQAVPLGYAPSLAEAFPLEVAQGAPVGRTGSGNRNGGRRRVGVGVATWEPPVELPPTSSTAPVLAYDVAHAFGPITQQHPTQPTFDVATATKVRQRDRILVGGVDVTYFRGVPTPLPSFQLIAPLLYGPATLSFPQVAGTYERIGEGALKWLRKGAPVLVQRVNADTNAVEITDYRGFIVAFNLDGAGLSVEVGGQLSGRAALTNRQPPLWHSVHDAGFLAALAVRRQGCRFTPRLGPTTGIRLSTWGGLSTLDYLNELCAKAQDRDGTQWTIMPGADGTYRMLRKDEVTIAATIYLDDARAVGSLRRDMAEEPNRVYMTGVNPHGRRLRGAVYPGLNQGNRPPYPYSDRSHTFGQGTTDADTETGDGISVMVSRLWVMKYLDLEDVPGGYDLDTTRAVRQLQEDAGLPVTGTMTFPAWKALFDLSAIGYSLRGSHIEPMAQRSAVKPWLLTSSGAKLARNPDYDPSVVPVDVNVDAGVGFDATQLREWARAEVFRGTDNWVGSIKIATGGVVRGTHNPGDPLVNEDLMCARDLLPGDNVWCPQFMGGTRLHVSAVSVDTSGEVSLTVDTRARDTMKVWEVIQRNRETRNNPARAWIAQHRSSTMTNDGNTEWDAAGGVIEKVRCPGNQWTVFPVPAGQEGTIRSLRIRTDNDRAEFVVALFGRKVTPKWLANRVPQPLTAPSTYTTTQVVLDAEDQPVLNEDGSQKTEQVTHKRHDNAARWESEAVRRKLDSRLLLYAAGTNEQPCGYFPGKKTNDDGKRTRERITGRHEDDAGVSYHTFAEPVIYVAIHPDRDTVVQPGRIIWNQLETGS